MLQALISSLLLAIHPAILAIANIVKGTIYINALSTTLGRKPVTIELSPGLMNGQFVLSQKKDKKQTLYFLRNNVSANV